MFFYRTQGKGWRSRKDFLRRAVTGCAAFFISFTLAIVIPLEPALAQSASDTATDTTSDASLNISSSSGTSSIATPTTADGSTSDTEVTDQSAAVSSPSADTSEQTSAAAQTENALKNTALSANAMGQQQTGPNLQPTVYSSFNQNQLKIDQNTGALDTTYPIAVPPGRNGMQPNVDLIYNSQNAQQGSIFGEGWTVSIPYISRLNLAGVENLYSTSTPGYFTSSLDGELATTTVSGSYIARTDNGTFNKYTFVSSTDSWTMTDKKGTQYVFGLSSNSQQSDPNNAAHVFKWMLQQVTDTNGNSVLYNYFNDSGQIYPSSAIYTNTSSTTGIFEVDFLRTTNAENAVSYATGFPVQSNYRVNEIDAKVNGTWVRKYVLNYTMGDNGATALLGSIAESGQNASGTVVSEPASTFTYQTATPGWTSSSTWNPPIPFVSSSSADNGVRVVDVNGDSLQDLVSSSSSYVNTGAGWASSSIWNSPVSFSSSTGGDNGYRLVDVNGTGLPAITSCSSSYVNTGNGWASSTLWNSPICFASSSVSTGAIIANVSGDGLPTILAGSASSTATSSKVFQVDSSSTLTNSMVSYWRMEGDSSDFVGSSNGTDTGTSYGTSTEKVNQYVDYSGSAETSFSAPIVNQQVKSIAFWFYVPSTWPSNEEGLIDTAVDGSNGWRFIINGNSWVGFGQEPYFWTTYPSSNFSPNTWYHLAATVDSSGNYAFYVNGVLRASGSGSYTSTSNSTLFGQEHRSGYNFTGYLDEIGIWNRALTATEVSNLYNSGSGQTMTTQAAGPSTVSAYVDTGSSWATSTIWAPPVPFVTSGGLDNGVRIADVNGDGLPDIIQRYTDASGADQSGAWLNTGNGWATSTAWIPPVSFTSAMGWDNGARIADVNGDGLPDIIQSYSDVSGNPHYAAWLNIGNSNTGNAWAPDPAWNPPDGALFDTDGGYDGGVRVADVLGDGLPAIISSHVNINNTNVSAAWTNNNVVRANILTGVSYPQGGSTQITYQAAAQSMNAEPYPIYTVSKITNNDGLGNLSSSTYQYANGTYYYANPTDHEFAGFKLVTQTDGAGNVTKTYYHTANGIDSAGGEYHDNFWKIGKAYRVENYDNAGHLYKAVITQWNSTSTGGNAAFVFPDQTIEMDYDGLSTHKDSAESYTWDVTNGNEIQKVQWGQVTESNDGAGASSSKSFEINTLSGGSLTNGLVSYYNLEGNANDYYGSNNGASNNALYGTNYGKVGQGAEFGSGKYIQLPSYLVAPTDSTSINLWFYQLGSGSGNQPQYSTIACGQSDSSENGGYWWACISGTAAYSTGNVSGGFAINGTRYQLDSGVAIPVNAWTMVTITYDRSTMRIYVNGVLRNSIAASGNIVPYGGGGLGPLRLGREQFAGDNDFNGYEDEPSVWNRALTANEISDLYNAGAGQTMVGSGYTIVGTKEYITNITYASSTNSNIVGKVSDETMLNGSSTKIQETQYYYDGLGIGGIGAGNLTAQDDWVSGGTYVTSTRNAYNSYGLVAQSFDPRNNTTTYSYDNYNLYPATTTNALGQTVGYQYDYSTGKPTQTINPNGLKFQTLYDGLGRPLQVLQPDQATTSTLDLKAAYTYIDTANAVSVHESDYLNASTTVDTYRSIK
jgi:hypothetical protein